MGFLARRVLFDAKSQCLNQKIILEHCLPSLNNPNRIGNDFQSKVSGGEGGAQFSDNIEQTNWYSDIMGRTN